MATKERSTVVGVFENRTQAEQAVAELKRVGFADDDIAVVMKHEGQATTVNVSDPDKARAARVSGETQAEEGATAGAVTGGVVGGLLAVAAPLLIPGIGPVLSLGTLAGAIFGAVAGAAGGGVIGALVGLDFPEEEARFYESELKAGRILVGVKVDGRYQDAVNVLRRCGAYDASSPGERHAGGLGAQPAAGTTTAGTTGVGTAGAGLGDVGTTGAGTTGAGTRDVGVTGRPGEGGRTP